MRVFGLFADDGLLRFSPSQNVNVWCVWTRAFFCEATVNNLPEEVLDDPESYFLEPTDKSGQPISLASALSGSNQGLPTP